MNCKPFLSRTWLPSCCANYDSGSAPITNRGPRWDAAAPDKWTVNRYEMTGSGSLDRRKESMTKVSMMAVLAAVSLGLPMSAAVGDDVPTYDMRKSCKADVQAYSTAQSVAGCLTDEQNARATLVSQWTQFAPESRSRCSQMVGDVAGPQSYVELLTCLQMAKDVKSLPKN